jgi:hypothetical protein
MDGGVISVGGAAASRLYTVVCNSKESDTGNIKCRADDGGLPSLDEGTVGDVLGVGDCMTYSQRSAPIDCIGAGQFVTSFECVR